MTSPNTPMIDHPPRFYTFWSINDRLDPDKLRRQLDDMRAAGFDGAVFHPRYYTNQPPYLSAPYLDIVSDAILHARSIGMEFWIYDEDGWPSGTAGGEMLRRYPDEACILLELSDSPPENPVHSFRVGPDNAILPAGARYGQLWHLGLHRTHGLDCLDPRACGHFLQLVHERYRQGLKPQAWEHVSAIFSDEPEFGVCWGRMPPRGAIPWTRRLPQIWRDRFGEDLLERLPLVFFPGTGHRQWRIKFWECMTDLFRDGFCKPYDDWCRAAGKTFTMHVKGEEHPLFQVPISGSVHRVFQSVSLPGIDALERYPSNNFFPRQIASVAQQFGDGRCMVECFGGSGWGARPQDLERYLMWLGGHGLTHYVLHLYQYRLKSQAIADWPPSIPNHLSWREAFPDVLRRFRQWMAQRPPLRADTLVVAPYRGIMAEYEPWELVRTNIHNAATYPDTPAGRLNRAFMDLVERLHAANVTWHVIDERSLEESGSAEIKQLRVGRCHYERVILADGVVLGRDGQKLIDTLGSAGVRVEHAGADVPPPSSAVVEVAAAPRAVIQPQWSVPAGQGNELVLDATAAGEQYTASFMCASTELGEMEVHFADDIASASVNGHALTLRREEDGVAGRVGPTWLKAQNQVRFRGQGALERPFVWLSGPFLVCCRGRFDPGPNGTVRTEGPFELRHEPWTPSLELIEAGYLFTRRPLTCVGQFVLERDLPGSELGLVGIAADAAFANLDGVDLGWIIGPRWRLPLGAGLKAGHHRLTLRLAPSTYNFYGPHHYLDGDRHIISPGQYSGRRNFADRDDAPDTTWVSAWHFKPLRPPRALELL